MEIWHGILGGLTPSFYLLFVAGCWSAQHTAAGMTSAQTLLIIFLNKV
jgi:hypothetical protein